MVWWSLRTALTIAASLAQIGEFSFILAGLGVALGVLPEEGRGLILAGAIISILLNPLVFEAAERLGGKAPAPDKGQESSAAAVDVPSRRSGFEEVLVGYGRVGSHLGGELLKAGRRPLVIEIGDEAVATARRDGAEVVVGNAADPEVLGALDLRAARRLFVTIPEAFEAGQVVEQARAAHAQLEIVARAHSQEAVEHLTRLGATLTIMGEREIAKRMVEHALAATEGAGPRSDPRTTSA